MVLSDGLLNKILLHSVALFSTGMAVTSFTVTPSLFSNPKNQTHQIGRYTGMGISIFFSAVGLTCGLVLDSKRSANKVARNLYLHRLATEQYWQEKQIEQEVPQLQQSYAPVTSVTKTQQGVTDFSYGVTEVPKVTDQLVEPELLELVTNAVTNGEKDSEIIKNILGYQGRNYQEGKRILEEIKEEMDDADD